MGTIFGQIIDGKIPAEKVFENERLIAIKDINPAAPVHLLIIPKKEIPTLQQATKEDLELLPEIFALAQQLAEKFGVADGYRLLVNSGAEAGQTVFHLHFHLIGGRRLGAMA
ncbi:MAG: histidine triad nucleotide-binding protein [Chlamydiales bacterium]|nr:histidine triad nucleotide-binding protein [Chlamydiales bacterium]